MKAIARLCLCCLVLVPVSARIAAAREPDAIRFAEKMPLADEELVLDATPTSFGAVAVGARGHVLLSHDGVELRQAESVPTRATLTAVDFVGGKGWAVGHDSVILHTDDAGETWTRQYFAPEREQPLLDVLFLDENHGLAVGAYDLFMETTDGGETWEDLGGVDETDDWHLNDILRTGNGTWLISAEQGLIYRSSDDMVSWEAVQLPYQGSMFGIIEMAPDHVLTFGLRGNAYRSDDDGESWVPVDTDTDSSLFGGRVLQSGEIVLVGNGGTIATSPSMDEPFSASQHADGEPLAGVIQARDGRLVFYGLNGLTMATPAEDTER